MNRKKVSKIVVIVLFVIMLAIPLVYWALFEHKASKMVQHEEGYEIRENEVVYWVCAFGCNPYQIIGADPETFQIINMSYGRDKNHIFFHYDIIEKADPESFTVNNGDWSFRAGDYIYKNGKVMKIDNN